jgi:hypothetical protein
MADPALRAQSVIDNLVRRGVLEGGLRIPNAVGPVQITADIRTSRITASVEIDAPREGRATTRVNWLLRQLKDASDGVRIDAYALHSRTGASALLKDVRNKPELLIENPKRELRTFHVALSAPMGTKRSQGRGSFITSVLDLLDEFYRSVVQSLKPWTAAPPKLRPDPTDVVELGVASELVSTAFSSQDDPIEAEDAGPPAWQPDPFEAEEAAEENASDAWDDTTPDPAAEVPDQKDAWWLPSAGAATSESHDSEPGSAIGIETPSSF